MNATATPTTAAVKPRSEELRDRADAVLMPNYGRRDCTLVRGRGALAYDADGREYLDFVQGIAVNNLGHCHPAIVEAIQRQAETLIHCANGVLIEPQIELAELLCQASGMTKAFFANSGAEVTEGAIKLTRLWARKRGHTDRTTIITFTGSFHGRTYGAMSATYSKKVREGFEPFAPGFRFAEYNSLEDVDAKWDDSVCGVILETIQGEGGVRPSTIPFLLGLRERCTARGACLIVDEVQCGMSRSGKPFAFQYAGITPDVVPVAKALGGGVPIGALLAHGEFADVFHKGSHGTTFGGNPLACAAGVAACRELFRPELLQSVGELGCHLWGRLEAIARRHPHLCDHVRGKGLMQGLVLKVNALDLPPVGRRHGILVNATAETVVRVLPPLIVTREQIDLFTERLEAALVEYANTLDGKTK